MNLFVGTVALIQRTQIWLQLGYDSYNLNTTCNLWFPMIFLGIVFDNETIGYNNFGYIYNLDKIT